MNDSLTEMIVERFYRTSGYLVERAVPIVEDNAPQHWSDPDVLAIKHEVLLVNCKDFVSDPTQKSKIDHNLKVAEEWVKRNYGDLAANKPIIRQLVYGGSDKATIEFLQKQGVVCKSLEEVLADYLAKLAASTEALNTKYPPPKGKRWYRIGNLTGYDKLLVYLMNQQVLKVENGQLAKWKQ